MYYVVSVEFESSGRRNDYKNMDAFLKQRFHATKIMKRQWFFGTDRLSAHDIFGAIANEFRPLFDDDDNKLLIVSLPDQFCEFGRTRQAWAATGIPKLEGEAHHY